eukprot:30248_1
MIHFLRSGPRFRIRHTRGFSSTSLKNPPGPHDMEIDQNQNKYVVHRQKPDDKIDEKHSKKSLNESSERGLTDSAEFASDLAAELKKPLKILTPIRRKPSITTRRKRQASFLPISTSGVRSLKQLEATKNSSIERITRRVAARFPRELSNEQRTYVAMATAGVVGLYSVYTVYYMLNGIEFFAQFSSSNKIL